MTSKTICANTQSWVICQKHPQLYNNQFINQFIEFSQCEMIIKRYAIFITCTFIHTFIHSSCLFPKCLLGTSTVSRIALLCLTVCKRLTSGLGWYRIGNSVLSLQDCFLGNYRVKINVECWFCLVCYMEILLDWGIWDWACNRGAYVNRGLRNLWTNVAVDVPWEEDGLSSESHSLWN